MPVVPMHAHTLSDFDYELPNELIAQTPAVRRSDSSLLHVDGRVLQDLVFSDFSRLVDHRDLVVFNDTRVVKARLHARRPTASCR